MTRILEIPRSVLLGLATPIAALAVSGCGPAAADVLPHVAVPSPQSATVRLHIGVDRLPHLGTGNPARPHVEVWYPEVDPAQLTWNGGDDWDASCLIEAGLLERVDMVTHSVEWTAADAAPYQSPKSRTVADQNAALATMTEVLIRRAERPAIGVKERLVPTASMLDRAPGLRAAVESEKAKPEDRRYHVTAAVDVLSWTRSVGAIERAGDDQWRAQVQVVPVPGPLGACATGFAKAEEYTTTVHLYEEFGAWRTP